MDQGTLVWPGLVLSRRFVPALCRWLDQLQTGYAHAADLVYLLGTPSGETGPGANCGEHEAQNIIEALVAAHWIIPVEGNGDQRTRVQRMTASGCAGVHRGSPLGKGYEPVGLPGAVAFCRGHRPPARKETPKVQETRTLCDRCREPMPAFARVSMKPRLNEDPPVGAPAEIDLCHPCALLLIQRSVWDGHGAQVWASVRQK